MSTRLALRETTASIHERIHRLPVFQLLEKGELSRPLYASLLLRFHGFFQPVEQKLGRAWPLLGDSAPLWRPRTPLLRKDLAELGVDDRDVLRAPVAAKLPALNSAAAVLGCLYVLEGSTLGGRVLARQLEVLFPQGSTSGRTFFLGGGEQKGASWRSCCQAIEAYGTDPVRTDEILDAAMKTFESFAEWFDGFALSRQPQ